MHRTKKEYNTPENAAFGIYSFGPVPTEPVPDRFVKLERLVKTEIYKERIELFFDSGKEILKLVINTPAGGGVHIFSENAGYFKPKKLFCPDIKKEENAVSFKTADNSVVYISFDPEKWLISIGGENGERLLEFGKDTFIFGYCTGNLEKIKMTFPIAEEMLFGCGERFNGIDQTGNRHQFWNCDAAYHGDSRHYELWKSYKNIPLIHSTSGYSLFYNSFYPANSDLGYTQENLWSWDFWGPTLDIYVWSGNVRKTLIQYTELTGKPFLPPKWAFRYMAGGGNGFWYGSEWGKGNNPAAYLKVLRRLLDGYENLGTPNIAAVYGEGWIADNPEAYDMLREYGIRMLNWNPPDYPIEIMRENLPGVPDRELPRIKRTDNIAEDAGNYIDFHNPNAKQMLINRYRQYFEMGLRGGMLDFAEMVPDYALYCNGMTGREMHNFNPYWYGKLYGEAAKELVGGDDYLYFCRGGCAGSQQWCANFSGDQAAKFYGLRQQLSSALTLGLCGFSAWGGDLAGYEGMPSEEVFCRGIEFSTFQPLMRAHGTCTRCPWDFGKTAAEVYKKYYYLRENLVSKLYSNAVASSKTGLPMMQAMALAFPEQKEITAVDSQYLFCDDMLVAPVFEQNAEFTKVHFPKGSWYDLWTGKKATGGKTQKIPVTILDIPVYLRSGTVMPVILSGNNLRLAFPFNADSSAEALLITPPDKKRAVTVYFDKNKSTEYITEPITEKHFSVMNGAKLFPKILLIYAEVCEVRTFGKEERCEIIKTADNISAIKMEKNSCMKIEIAFK